MELVSAELVLPLLGRLKTGFTYFDGKELPVRVTVCCWCDALSKLRQRGIPEEAHREHMEISLFPFLCLASHSSSIVLREETALAVARVKKPC